MRRALSALVLWSLVCVSSLIAQTHRTDSPGHSSSGTSHTCVSGTTSTASASTHSGAVSTGTPRHWAITPSSSSSSSGRDHDRHSYGDNHHHRTWGGPYTYSYGVDYSGHNTQQQDEADDQGFLAELARVQQNRQDDERRQRELDRQLADQRAADAAPPTVRNIATAPSSPTEREST